MDLWFTYIRFAPSVLARGVATTVVGELVARRYPDLVREAWLPMAGLGGGTPGTY